MRGIATMLTVLAFLLMGGEAFAQEFNVYDPYGQSFDTDYSSPTWQPSVPSTGGGSTGGSAGSTGGTVGSSTSGTTAAVIPAGAVAVTLNGGKGPVYYANNGKEEKNAVGDWTLMKIYARSPLGIANYTQSIGVITSKKEGASFIYGDGYIFSDKLPSVFGGIASPPSPPVVSPKPAVAPLPAPAVPIPSAPTPLPAVPDVPRAPVEDVPSFVVSAPESNPPAVMSDVQPTAPHPTPQQPPALRRIVRGINTFFSSIVRWFQRIGR